MADTSKYMIGERLIISVWIHEKEGTGETDEEIRENFYLRFNKAVPSKANLQEAPTSQREQLAVVLLKRKSFNYSDGFC